MTKLQILNLVPDHYVWVHKTKMNCQKLIFKYFYDCGDEAQVM